MKIISKKIKGAFEIKTTPAYNDNRGNLIRLYDADFFLQNGLKKQEWQQQTYQHSKPNYILRGLHTQRAPFTEAKLINIVSGKMFWVFVDLRKNSTTFGKWDSTFLSVDGINGLFIERGFAHGCLSLEENTMLVINADNYFSSDYGEGIAHDDPELQIKWPIVNGADLIISEEHKNYPSFAQFREKYDGL